MTRRRNVRQMHRYMTDGKKEATTICGARSPAAAAWRLTPRDLKIAIDGKGLCVVCWQSEQTALLPPLTEDDR